MMNVRTNSTSITGSQRIAYGYLTHMILLLVVYAAALLLEGVKLFAPDPLVNVLPYHQAAMLEQIVLALAVESGLIGGGLYLISVLAPDMRLDQTDLLKVAYRLWSAVCLASVVGSIFGVLQTGNGLSLVRVLDTGVILVIGLTLISVVMSSQSWTALPAVWVLVMVGLLLSHVIELLPPNTLREEITIRALSIGLREQIIFPLGITVMLFWLIGRFSHAPGIWIKRGLYTVTGLQAMAGALLILPIFYSLFASPIFSIAGGITIFFIPIVYLIFASHSYRGFSDRNSSRTLSAHWAALGVIGILIGAGFIGAANAVPAIAAWTMGTRWTNLQQFLVMGGSIAILLGVVNQVGAELIGQAGSGQNGRITGLVPFWLITFGLLGGGFALALIGIVQVYLARGVGIAYLESEALIAPLYFLWVLCLIVFSLGIGIFALGFWIRRPRMLPALTVAPPKKEYVIEAAPQEILF